MGDDYPTINALGISPKTNVCFYGIPGIGKTRLIGSGSDTLIIRPPTDHTDSIRGGAKRNVKEVVIRNWDDMRRMQNYLVDHGKDWDWVWIDSISLIQDILLDSIWAQVVAEKPHRARFGLDKGEYGINIHRLGLWVRDVIGLEAFNFGVTGHPFETINENDDPIFMPYVQGKNMPQKICGYMNVVGFMSMKRTNNKQVRSLSFAATDRYYAKDQFDAFDKHRLNNPTMPSFIEQIEAARAANSPTTKTKRTKGKRT